MTIGDDGIATRDNTGASWKGNQGYKLCKLYTERKFHDWRWLGWPLTDPACEERWCEICGLVKRPHNGKWAEVGYRQITTAAPAESSEGFHCDACAERYRAAGGRAMRETATTAAIEAATREAVYEACRYFDELYLASAEERAKGRHFTSAGTQPRDLAKRLESIISRHFPAEAMIDPVLLITVFPMFLYQVYRRLTR